jgi:hypothetical protein
VPRLYLRVFFKFEGIDERTGELGFYINISTCDEAPYFRLKYSTTLFETEFKVKTLAQLRTIGKRHMLMAIKAVGG